MNFAEAAILDFTLNFAFDRNQSVTSRLLRNQKNFKEEIQIIMNRFKWYYKCRFHVSNL